MMKNNIFKLLFFTLFLFILNMNFCYADIYRGKINGTGVNLRSGPGTSYDSLKTLSNGGEYNLVDNTLYKDEGGCTKGWYKIYYEGSSSGYVCSDYVEVSTVVYNENPTNDCETIYKEAGFPATYWGSLCKLKESHSNWDFKPIFTGLDWSSAVNSEAACGKSYIASNDSSNIDTSCKNIYTKTWYPASSTAVAYYMDPRNWLTEQYIFQFEYLKYDSGFANAYADAARDIIDHAEFYKYHLGLNNDLGIILNEAGKNVNVSPIFIASRILQELGSGTSEYDLYSGVYKGYEGFYNFYNFGVNDSCAVTGGPTACGLEYAKKNNWYGLKVAIEGGASQIANSYINKGQYTGYLQKFNVSPTDSSKLYGHQYMTNIAAPSSESKSAYNTYKTSDLLKNAFVFYIPVYNNMDDTHYNQNNGAIDTPDNKTSSDLDISTIIISSGFKYAGGMISGINPNTSINNVKNALESIAGSGNVTIKNSNDNIVNDGLIGTGFKVTIKNAKVSETVTVVINGDTSGDGIINALDLLQVQKNLLGTYSLNGVYNMAGDTSDDGIINALDLLQIQKNILGTYTLVQ